MHGSPPKLLTMAPNAILPPIPAMPRDDRASVRASWLAATEKRRQLGAHPDALSLISYGREAEGAGDLISARQALRSALGKSPAADLRAYGDLGSIEILLGLHTEALQTYRRLQALAPGEAMGYIGESRALYAAAFGREGPSLVVLKRGAAALDPQNVGGHLGLSEEFDTLFDYQDALSEAEQARRAAPKEPGVLLSLCTLLLQMHRATEAQHLLEQLLSQNPNLSRAHTLLADALDDPGRRRDRRSAEHHYLSALELDPHDQRALEHLGRMYLEQRRLRPALYVYTLLARERPDDGSVRMALAQGYAQLGNTQVANAERALAARLISARNARAALTTRRDHQPGNPAIRMALARRLEQDGRYRDALIEAQAAVMLAPHSDDARKALLALCRRVGIPPPPALYGERAAPK
ncbi:MAG: tetratricopeptide repeat protein [Chthonomonadales bacterium]